MQQGVLAPVITVALFLVCFSLSAFLRLAIGRPLFKSKPKKTRTAKPKPQKVYFITDVSPVKEQNPFADKILQAQIIEKKQSE